MYPDYQDQEAPRKSKNFYSRDGKKYAKITSVLSIINKPQLNKWRGDIGNEKADQIMHEAAQFGREFHSFCEMIDRGEGWDIPLDKINEPMRSMVEKYRAWFYENVKSVILTEEEIYSDKYLFAGRLDTVYEIKGIKGPVLVDRKTGKFLDYTASMQMAAYKHGLNEDKRIDASNRMLIQITRLGVFEVKILPNDEYLRDFQNFLYAKELYLAFNAI